MALPSVQWKEVAEVEFGKTFISKLTQTKNIHIYDDDDDDDDDYDDVDDDDDMFNASVCLYDMKRWPTGWKEVAEVEFGQNIHIQVDTNKK